MLAMDNMEFSIIDTGHIIPYTIYLGIQYYTKHNQSPIYKTYFQMGPEVNIHTQMSQFRKLEETGDPGENLQERAWIGRPVAHTACSRN